MAHIQIYGRTQEFDEGVYMLTRYNSFENAVNQTCLRLKSEGYISGFRFKESVYHNYTKHLLNMEIDTRERQVVIQLFFEPVHLWFLDQEQFVEEMAMYLMQFYKKCKQLFTTPSSELAVIQWNSKSKFGASASAPMLDSKLKF